MASPETSTKESFNFHERSYGWLEQEAEKSLEHFRALGAASLQAGEDETHLQAIGNRLKRYESEGEGSRRLAEATRRMLHLNFELEWRHTDQQVNELADEMETFNETGRIRNAEGKMLYPDGRRVR